MNRHIKNGVVFYTFELFDKHGIKHCFSTRIGGVSSGCRNSMNLSFNGDSSENVTENFKRLCGAVGFNFDDIVFSNQVHKTAIYKVTSADRGKGLYKASDIKEIDGLITSDKNVVLTTFYADCVPLYFFDIEKGVAALSHAGWKGTLGEMAKKTVSALSAEYGSKPSNIIAGIGPSICGNCYEVGEDVRDSFLKLHYSNEFIIKSPSSNKYFIDLPAINKYAMQISGIPSENIELSSLCTLHSDETEFFSHRRTGANRGSLAAFIQI